MENNGEVFPWRQTTDDCEVFIAEVLLQRAPGKQVEGVYEDLLHSFPDPNVERHFDKNFESDLDKRPHNSQYFRELTSALTPRDSEIARAFFLSMIDLDADKDL